MWFKIYQIVLVILQYAIPLMIISFAYIRMGIKLWLTHTPGNAHDQRLETKLSKFSLTFYDNFSLIFIGMKEF